MSGRKNKLCFISVLFCCLLLSGCSKQKTVSVLPATDKKTDLSVSWWGDDLRNNYMLQTLSSFTRQYPEIRLSMNYTTKDAYQLLYDARNAAAMDCDVIQISYEQLLDPDASLLFYPLSEIKDCLNLHLQSSDSITWGTIDGTLYALSNSVDIPSFYYNEALLAHLGMDVPNTWEELFALSSACSKENLYPLVMTEEDLFVLLNAWMEQHTGSAMFQEDGTLCYTRAQLTDLLSFYQKLMLEHVVLVQDDPIPALCASQTVGCFSRLSLATTLELAFQDTGTLISGNLLTMQPESARFGWYQSPGLLYAISKTSRQPRESAKLFRFLLSSDATVRNQGLKEGYLSTSGGYQLLYSENRLHGLAVGASVPFLEHRDAFSLLPAELASHAVCNQFFTVASAMLEQNGSPDAFANQLYDALQNL